MTIIEGYKADNAALGNAILKLLLAVEKGKKK